MKSIQTLAFVSLLIFGATSCDDQLSSDPIHEEDPISDDPISEDDPISDPSLTGIMKSQYETDLEIYTEVKNGNYSINNPFVVVDPYEVAPLSAYIAFTTEEAVSISVSIEEQGDLEAITHTFGDQNTLHFIPIYGLYEDFKNQVKLTTSKGETATITVETATVQSVPSVTISSAQTSKMASGLTVTMGAIDNLQVAFDAEGELRMAFNEGYIGGGNNFFVAQNGNFISSGGALITEPYYRTHVYELNAMGKLLASYEIPDATHHDIRELPSGNLIVATNSSSTSKSEDVVIEVDRSSGAIVKTWDIGDYLPKDAGSSLLETGSDWFHNNSVYFDESREELILSGRHRDVVIAIDYNSDQLSWIFGSPDGWDTSLLDYFFTPTGNEFEWQWGQHSAIITDLGDLFVFDNGNYRSKDKNNAISDDNNYSRAVIYNLDTDDMTTAQTWQYGKERGNNFYSSYISEVNYIDNNHYLIVSGAASSSSGNRPGSSNEAGIIVEIVNDEVVFEMQSSSLVYRVERIDAYSQTENQFLEKGIAY